MKHPSNAGRGKFSALIVCSVFILSSGVPLALGNLFQADFFSYVNWDYQHRNDLKGWKNSAKLIRASLQEWGYTIQGADIENTGANGLFQFQQTIVARKSAGLKLIYLASHQTPSGRIDFPDENRELWSDRFDGHGKVFGNPSVLLLDVCHADVIPQVRMNGTIPFHYLLSAAAANEETYELRMFARRPVDFRRRYPAEVQWMKDQLGSESKGEVSEFYRVYLGASVFENTAGAQKSSRMERISAGDGGRGESVCKATITISCLNFKVMGMTVKP